MMRTSLYVVLICSLIGCQSEPTDAPAPNTVFDVLLLGGTVYDGTGEDPVVMDIGLIADTIAALGDLAAYDAHTRVDVQGLAVASGFIDIHSHATSFTATQSGLYQHPTAENYLRQGVTTVITGQDGGSAYPLDAFFETMAAQPRTINLGTMIGHGTVRRLVLGNADRAPTAAEQTEMMHMVETAMRAGAFGLSSGLEYPPGAYAKTEELIALAQVAAAHEGIYISHIRDEGGQLLDSVAEVIQIGREGGLPAQVTHHKIIGKQRWGGSAQSLALIDEARAEGLDISSDVYPYTASSTGLGILFPKWALEGDGAAVRTRLQTPETRARIKDAVATHIHQERGSDPATIVLASCPFDPALNGKSLADILTDRQQPVTVENAADVAMELLARGSCQGVFHSMSEEDVIRILQHPQTMVCSDGGIPTWGSGVPHPRNYGAFARVLGYFVREKQALSWGAAIHKMTQQPAQRLGLPDRGVLQVGAHADLAIFDPQRITDTATFTDPHQYAIGVTHVLVNGVFVLKDEHLTTARPGRLLRKGQ